MSRDFLVIAWISGEKWMSIICTTHQKMEKTSVDRKISQLHYVTVSHMKLTSPEKGPALVTLDDFSARPGRYPLFGSLSRVAGCSTYSAGGGSSRVGPLSKPQDNPSKEFCDWTVPQSRHSGGITASFADGSTRFISASIDGSAWWALCTPNQGDVVGNE